MIINQFEKSIQIKIVYYGSAMSGKTTSLKYLMGYYGKANELQSIETSTGRTLVFDHGTLSFPGDRWNLKISLLSATGQDFYMSTRPSTLKMVDGLIFVIDSQKKYLEDNLRSWNELFLYFGENIHKLPIILCLNKQDLADLIDPEYIIRFLNISRINKVEIIKTVAVKGEGVINSFNHIIKLIFPSVVLTV